MLKKYIIKQTFYVNNATISCMVSCFEQKSQKASKNKAKSQNTALLLFFYALTWCEKETSHVFSGRCFEDIQRDDIDAK